MSESLLGDGGTEVFGLAVGDNGIILRTSGQDTISFLPVNSGTTEDLNGLAIRSGAFQVLTVGDNGTIVRSTDRGETWAVIPAVTSSHLYGVCFGFGGYQFAAGDNGVILRSSNLGLNWSVVPSGTTRNLKAVSSHPSDIEYVIATGEKGTILRSTNYGFSWVNVSLPDTTIDFNCINQATSNGTEISNFYIAGSQGKIYKSTNHGATWVLKSSGTTNTLRSIYFSTDDSGAVTGDNGTVRMTTNGGETWFTDPYFANASGSITSISRMPRSSKTVTALSDNNTLLVASENSITVVIGIQNVNTEIPMAFSLSQNYPNPFNPKTNIDLKLNKSGFVKLVIYDVSGKELKTLISKHLKAGVYKVDWDGSKYSSGIYFYKIFTDEFRETKKMILIK